MEHFFDLIESVSPVMTNLKESGILDFVCLIFSTIIPIIIMVFTLRSEKKTAKQALFEQEKQYEDSKKIAELQHKEQLEAQNEINRIAIMPYFIIEDVNAKVENAKLKFSIILKNIGNGIAINLTTKYIESNSGLLCVVCETKLATYFCTAPFDVYNANARTGDKCELEISQELIGKDENNYDYFRLDIKYTDMKQKQYQQTFAIYFDACDLSNIKIAQRFTNNPETI